ncbi:aldo/keto reductase [Myxococcota bacterium]|nr:aldo/keto reductase [Myxococcota bacterium]MBU1432274.1 aldo/keto reductase [Myxococcota bacterium]MBU1899792.1 aldo/keto reductase [Myxococcota bacterium]
MEYRFLGRTGLKISRLAMGTMSFGGDADARTSAALYHQARAAGINLFDCADVYNGGEAERILGRLIAAERDQIVLTSKSYFPTRDDPNARGSSRFHLVRAVEASLRRLNTDRIDLFFLHRFDEQTALDETLRALDDLVSAGKILYPAASNFTAWQAMKALGIAEARGWARLAALQPMYNLVKRQAEVEILPMAHAEGLGVISYSPLGGGLLSGRYAQAQRPERGRLVENMMYATRYGEPGYYAVATRLSALAAEVGAHPASLAIAWVAAHPAITAPLLGARDVAQLAPALRALEVPMDEALYQRISALWPAPPPATDRNEEASRHNYGAR